MVGKPPRPHEAPGYKVKPSRDGAWREYWQCRTDVGKRGFRPTNVRLYFPETPAGRDQLAARCWRLQAEMLSWSHAGGDFLRPRYDGTMRGLVRAFQIEVPIASA